jgi:glycosyltransferase involved in cell wall biosynthesis
MNILLFNWRDPTHPWAGGAEVFSFEVARRWVQQGHRVTWLCGRHRSQPASGELEGIDILRRGGIYSVYPLAAWSYVSHLRGRFDVLLDSANGIPFFTPLFSAAPKLALVHHVHREVFFCELPWHLAQVGSLLERWAMPLIYRHVPFVAVSDSSRNALIQLGISADRISIVHNGVDSSRYRPGPKAEIPLVVFVGRLRRYKRIDVAIRALPKLLDTLPNLRFSIVGSGPIAPALQALAQELGVDRHVRWHGHVSEQDKVQLLQQAHVVVNPSMKEGWGLTVLEANACGTPVVAANVDGLCDAVQHGRTGLLVPYGDPPSLAAGVQTLLLDGEQRQHLSHGALAWAREFDWDRSAQQCLELLMRCQAERTGV